MKTSPRLTLPLVAMLSLLGASSVSAAAIDRQTETAIPRTGMRKLAMAFVKEANELQKVAATGDVAAIKAQFGKTGESCKACHDKFRKDE